MRGKVLGFDAAGGTGAISGSDGRRYNFAAAQWRGEGPPTPGVYVDFDSTDGSTATALFPEVKTVFTPPPTSRPPAGHPQPGGPPPQGQPGGPPPQAYSSAPGPYPQPGPASGGYPQPGPAAGGYPQPGARSPYPGQQPQPGPPPRAPYPGSYAGGGPSENYPPAGGYPGQPYPGQKSKVAAGLLALFLGGFGAHKFYLGYTTEGLILLGASFVSFVLWIVLIGLLGTTAIGIITLVEAIIYLTKSDAEFEQTYVQHKRPWF